MASKLHSSTFSISENSNLYILLRDACINDSVDILKFLIHLGIDVNKQIMFSGGAFIPGGLWLPLQYCILENRYKAIPLLLQSGADPNLRGSTSMSPLHWAARDGQEQIVVQLLEAGVDVDARNDSGMTALHLAAENNFPSIIKLLLMAGASTAIHNNENSTALDIAARKTHVEARDLILENIGGHRGELSKTIC